MRANDLKEMTLVQHVPKRQCAYLVVPQFVHLPVAREPNPDAVLQEQVL